ncbi:MAG TPA: carboxypeptidase regulatory-like domain-containing protein [Pyrinomonadaceae bacterium]|nr:carboxypeptidase regulatory-like domain-containing protein [Pyrinomonadaceae bacterium]
MSFEVGSFAALGVLALIGSSFSTATTQKKPIYQSTGSEATIAGRILFKGKPPNPMRIDMAADPICYKVNPHPTTEWIVVKDQKLANVVVYVGGDSLDAYSFETPSSEVTLDHRGCRYVPHVLGIQTNQTLNILNSDPTFQNTYMGLRNNPFWNQAQQVGAAPLKLSLVSPELFAPVKNALHPWENAYVSVFSHPFFSVSGTDGTYKISGLPPGKYTVVARHERLGEQRVDVSLAAREHKLLDFTYEESKR